MIFLKFLSLKNKRIYLNRSRYQLSPYSQKRDFAKQQNLLFEAVSKNRKKLIIFVFRSKLCQKAEPCGGDPDGRGRKNSAEPRERARVQSAVWKGATPRRDARRLPRGWFRDGSRATHRRHRLHKVRSDFPFFQFPLAAGAQGGADRADYARRSCRFSREVISNLKGSRRALKTHHCRDCLARRALRKAVRATGRRDRSGRHRRRFPSFLSTFL